MWRKFWSNFCKALDIEGSVKYQYASGDKLKEMFEVIRSILKSRSLDEWLRVLPKEDLPRGPVHELNEAFEDPQIPHRKMIVEVEYPAVGKIKQLGTPLKFSKTPCEI